MRQASHTIRSLRSLITGEAATLFILRACAAARPRTHIAAGGSIARGFFAFSFHRVSHMYLLNCLPLQVINKRYSCPNGSSTQSLNGRVWCSAGTKRLPDSYALDTGRPVVRSTSQLRTIRIVKWFLCDGRAITVAKIFDLDLGPLDCVCLRQVTVSNSPTN